LYGYGVFNDSDCRGHDETVSISSKGYGGNNVNKKLSKKSLKRKFENKKKFDCVEFIDGINFDKDDLTAVAADFTKSSHTKVKETTSFPESYTDDECINIYNKNLKSDNILDEKSKNLEISKIE